MSAHLTTLAFNKKMCTGVELSYREPATPDPLPDHKDGFDALVTEFYKLLREMIRDDVAFLRSVENHTDIKSFDTAVYQLRTARQHNDNRTATAFYTQWTAGRSWAEASAAFLDSADRALGTLARISSTVRRNPKHSTAWREMTSVQTEAIFAAVCHDLKASYPDGRRQAMLRNIDHRRRRLRPGPDIRARVEEFCAQEVSSTQDTRLPVPYHSVLDRLGLLGSYQARSALLIAYAVSQTTRLTGDAFLDRVQETWLLGTS
ncbi:hypothetical protein [Actinoplanes sp. G11-F43]|uniref:hypothetical protein n=1 Tax=Actinoplanes sp. G11-F43 TaxID=3424130 RepID=UPI003D349FD7